MATVEELVHMTNTLQGQQHALNRKVTRLTAENRQFRNAGSPGPTEIATAVGTAFRTGTASANTGSNERQGPVDIKGLGKPPVFNGEAARFTQWRRKTTGFLITAYGSAFRPVIEWVEDQDNVTTNDELERQFGPVSDGPVDAVLERREQVHVALSAVTEGESFDIVLGAAPSGLEALRRSVRRWDLLNGQERQILVPGR